MLTPNNCPQWETLVIDLTNKRVVNLHMFAVNMCEIDVIAVLEVITIFMYMKFMRLFCKKHCGETLISRVFRKYFYNNGSGVSTT